MSIERDHAYYDEYYAESVEYRKHYTDSVYYELWKRVIPLVPDVEIDVVDVGCGSGQFAQMLCESHPNIRYSGFDFSKAAIDVAIEKIPGRFHYGVKCASLYEYKYSASDFIVCLEVLEHIRDLEFLNRIPLGVEIVFTIPDFADQAHVRYFKSVAEVVFRYHTHIQFSHIEKFGSWFVCKGVRI